MNLKTGLKNAKSLADTNGRERSVSNRRIDYCQGIELDFSVTVEEAALVVDRTADYLSLLVFWSTGIS